MFKTKAEMTYIVLGGALKLYSLTYPRAKARTFEAKATTFCPQAVLEVEDSPRGPNP